MRGRAGGGLDVDGEGGFFHAELLYPLFDVAGECRCGFLPGGAECSGFAVVVGFGGAAGGFEFAAALVFLRECLVFGGKGLPVRGQLFGVDVVFARERVQGAHPRFGFGKRCGVVFNFIQLFGERIAGLTQVHGALFEQFGGFAVVVVDGGEVFGFALGLAQGALQVVLAVAQLVGEFAAAREDLVGAGKQALAGSEFVKFAVLGRDLFDFVELVGEQGEAFFVVRARVLPGFVLFFEVLPVAVGVSAGGEQFAVVGVAVEAAALFVVFQERLVVVLAVDVDQGGGEGFEFAAGHALVVHPGFAAAVAQGAADVDLAGVVRVVEAVFGKRLLVCAAQFAEGGADGGACLAVADAAGVGAFAEDEAEGVDENGFARAGFAGQDVVAGTEGDFAVFDDGDLVDGELFEHGLSVAVFGGDAPVEFGAQAILEVVVFRMQHRQRDAGADGDAVFVVQAVLLLAVDAQLCAARFGAGGDGNGAVGVNDDRALGEGVRADGDDEADRQVRLDDGPAGGERVGGGAGRGGDDEAVGAVVAEVAVVVIDVQLDHLRLAAADDGVVDGEVFAAAVATFDGDAQGVALFAVVMAGQDVVKLVGKIVEGEVGEKAEAAGVDANQRDLPVNQRAAGVEEGAVATDDDAQVNVVPSANRPRGGDDLVFGRHGVGVKAVAQAALFQDGDGAREGILHADGAEFADDADVAEGLGHGVAGW